MSAANMNVMITRGGSGIGFELGRRLVSRNTVTIGGRDPDRLRGAAEVLPSLRTWSLEVADVSSVARAVDEIVRDMGGLDLLVNAAGTISAYDIGDPDAEALAERDVAINS